MRVHTWRSLFAVTLLAVTGILLVPAAVLPGGADGPGVPHADKVVHALLFAGLALLALESFPRAAPAAVVLALAAYGVLIEGVQGLVPGRTPSAGDALANAMGAALAPLFRRSLRVGR